MQTNVTVIIRSVGERTESLCRQLVLQQVPEENVRIVSNTPFSATLKDSFNEGIESRLKWTLCVDADVLLCPEAIGRLVAMAEKTGDGVCEIQGLILDKFFGGSRHGGPHLYRTSLLPKALDLIPGEGTDLRPEYYTLQAMKASGHPWVRKSEVLGVHDFEQYYCDIYRKCFVQAHKHDYLAELFIRYWRRMAREDSDFKAALIGFAAGIAETGNVRIDASNFTEDIGKILNKYGLAEKPELAPGKIAPEEIGKIISGWAEPEEYAKYFSSSEKLKAKTIMKRLGESKKGMGVLRFIPWLIGCGFYKAGRKLMGCAAYTGKRNGRET